MSTFQFNRWRDQWRPIKVKTSVFWRLYLPPWWRCYLSYKRWVSIAETTNIWMTFDCYCSILISFVFWNFRSLHFNPPMPPGFQFALLWVPNDNTIQLTGYLDYQTVCHEEIKSFVLFSKPLPKWHCKLNRKDKNTQ